MAGMVEEVFITSEGSAAMERVEEARALEGCGLEGDRYCRGTGYWTRFGDVCEVTLIEAEDLEEIRNEGLKIENGEHRRNIITCGVRLEDLRGTRFRVGEVTLEYDRPRPPCGHVQKLTEPGMTRALRKRGGICARVVAGGRIRPRDEIEPLEAPARLP
ncbi:MAG: MOSC domain-containing protein [Rubrobacteraceae bacterium]